MNDGRYRAGRAILPFLFLAAAVWVMGGVVLWTVEIARQDYIEHGHYYLVLWSGGRIFVSLLPRVLIGGLLYSLAHLLVRPLREDRRVLVLTALCMLAGLGVLLWLGFHLNRYTLIGFWKEVRNTRAVPGWGMTGPALGANAGLILLISFLTYLLIRVSRFLAGVRGGRNPLLISPRVGVSVLAVGIAVLLAASLLQPSPHDARNVLVIALDTVRQDHLTSCGYPRETTPNLSRLSREGVLFANTFSQAPWTLSSFASLLTGLYPSSHGAFIGTEERHLHRDHIPLLPKRVATLAEAFKNRGYATGCEATNTYLRLGLEQGYDWCRVEIRGAEETVDAMIDWMEENAGRPFYAFLHFNDAHLPNSPPPPFDQMFRTSDGRPHTNEEKWTWLYTDAQDLGSPEFRTFQEHKIAVYDACIRYIDWQIGRMLFWLEEHGHLENTLIVVITDHGEEFWEHARLEVENYHDPRGIYGVGHGHTLFDEQLRLLLLVSGPDLPEGRILANHVRAVDLVPTILELAGLRVPRGVQGASLLPLLAGEERGDRPALSEAIIFGSDRKAVLREGFKYIHSPDEPDLLFDLTVDPGETRNLIDVEKERAASMWADLEAWLASQPKANAHVRGHLDEKTIEELKSLGYVE